VRSVSLRQYVGLLRSISLATTLEYLLDGKSYLRVELGNKLREASGVIEGVRQRSLDDIAWRRDLVSLTYSTETIPEEKNELASPPTGKGRGPQENPEGKLVMVNSNSGGRRCRWVDVMCGNCDDMGTGSRSTTPFK